MASSGIKNMTMTTFKIHLIGRFADEHISSTPNESGYYKWNVENPKIYMLAIKRAVERIDGTFLESIKRESIILTVLASTSEAADHLKRSEAKKVLLEKINENVWGCATELSVDFPPFQSSDLMSWEERSISEKEFEKIKKDSENDWKMTELYGLKGGSVYQSTQPSDASAGNVISNALSMKDLSEVIQTLQNIQDKQPGDLNKEDVLLSFSADLKRWLEKYNKCIVESKEIPEKVLRNIFDIIRKNVNVSPNDIAKFAEKPEMQKQNAVLFYYVAAEFYAQLKSIEGAKKIQQCVSKMYEIIKAYGKSSSVTIITVQLMTLMLGLIEGMTNINTKTRVLTEAWCLHFIVLGELVHNEWGKCKDLIDTAINRLQNAFGDGADKYEIYGRCWHDLGHIYCKMSHLQESKKAFTQALTARESATDCESRERQKEYVEATELNLEIVKKKLQNKSA